MNISASHRSPGNTRNAMSLLSTVQSFVANSKYLEATDVTRQLKRAFPHDTFIIALNVQTEKLHLAKGPEEAASVLRSIVPIIQKAMDSLQNNSESSQSGDTDVESQKRSALAQVKAQYRSHAEEHLKLGDYDGAIAEMHRILVIDPDDTVAVTFIEKVAELKSVRGVHSGGLTQDQVQYEPMPASLNELMSKSSVEFDSILAKASPALESASARVSKGALKEMPKRVAQNKATGKSKKNSKTQLLLGSAFFIILAIVVSYFLTTANQPENNLPQEKTQAQTTNLVQQSGTAGSTQSRDAVAEAAAGVPHSVSASTTTQQATDSLTHRGNE